MRCKSSPAFFNDIAKHCGDNMTITEARKLKIGDKVVVKSENRIIEIASIKEKMDCSGLRKYIEISGMLGGFWSHKEIQGTR